MATIEKTKGEDKFTADVAMMMLRDMQTRLMTIRSSSQYQAYRKEMVQKHGEAIDELNDWRKVFEIIPGEVFDKAVAYEIGYHQRRYGDDWKTKLGGLKAETLSHRETGGVYTAYFGTNYWRDYLEELERDLPSITDETERRVQERYIGRLRGYHEECKKALREGRGVYLGAPDQKYMPEWYNVTLE